MCCKTTWTFHLNNVFVLFPCLLFLCASGVVKQHGNFVLIVILFPCLCFMHACVIVKQHACVIVKQHGNFILIVFLFPCSLFLCACIVVKQHGCFILTFLFPCLLFLCACKTTWTFHLNRVFVSMVALLKMHAPYICGFAWNDMVPGCMV